MINFSYHATIENERYSSFHMRPTLKHSFFWCFASLNTIKRHINECIIKKQIKTIKRYINECMIKKQINN